MRLFCTDTLIVYFLKHTVYQQIVVIFFTVFLSSITSLMNKLHLKLHLDQFILTYCVKLLNKSYLLNTFNNFELSKKIAAHYIGYCKCF
jgi:hypothetical protein